MSIFKISWVDIGLDHECDEVSTILGVVDKLSAVYLETKRDKLLAIFDELAVLLEILIDMYALRILCEICVFARTTRTLHICQR